LSDVSQVFELDDIFTFWVAISKIITVKTPIVPPWQFIVDCQMIFTQFSHCVLIAVAMPVAVIKHLLEFFISYRHPK
jgi:hypothetical protein